MDSPRVKSPRARRDVARARDKNDSPRLLFMLGAYLEASVFPRTTRFPIRLSSLLYNLRGGRRRINLPMEYKVASHRFDSVVRRLNSFFSRRGGGRGVETTRFSIINFYIFDFRSGGEGGGEYLNKRFFVMFYSTEEFAIYKRKRKLFLFGRNPARSSNSLRTKK